MDSSHLYLEESAFYQDMKSKNDKVGEYWILDFIEI